MWQEVQDLVNGSFKSRTACTHLVDGNFIP